MWLVTKNPPLGCYYLAAAACVLGWSEIALHAAFLFPAMAVIIGTYRLALHFCERPIFAAATTLFTPVFLISSTSVMCDTLMLAFWIWAVLLWVEGMAKPDLRRLIVSALLMTLAAYTKYFGICLVPLLAAYSLIKQRGIGRWALCFLIPVAGMMLYQAVTFVLYGRGLFSDAGEYATNPNFKTIPTDAALTALAFTGGCVAVATLLTPWLWSRKTVAALIFGASLFACAIFASGSPLAKYAPWTGKSFGLVGAQVIFWSIGGVSILALAMVDAWQRRDANSYLLALWIWGTFLFAGFVNWTVNGRSILPLAPAVAILLARRLDRHDFAGDNIPRPALWPCSVFAGVLALLVTRADFKFAQTVRESARVTSAKYAQGPGTLWFEGHWGWQYYIEQLGAKAMSMSHPPQKGDLLAIPANNTNLILPDGKLSRFIETISVVGPQWLATLSGNVGAGFYTSMAGPLPFAFGPVPPEQVTVFALKSTSETTPPNLPAN